MFYLQVASTHSNQGRPLDTVLRAAPVAVEAQLIWSDFFCFCMMCVFLCVCVCVCVCGGGGPTLLGPITFFFKFFLGPGCAAGSPSPSALGSMQM